jgi:phage terminase large subunit-like protein
MGAVQQADHVADALEYAQDVLAGLTPACKWVKAACRRQLDDLDRWQNDPEWAFDWKPELADRVIRFVELLPHVKDGANWSAGTPIRLVPAQKFSLACVFGWVRKVDGRRRFRTVYEEVPRKNAKTTKLAPIGLYMLVADGEIGAEVYSAATKEEQARIVFNIAQQMARLEPDFRATFACELYRKAIAVRDTGSTFRPLAADGDSLDGLNVSCALIDELHAHKTRAVYDVLDSGRGSRAQPLLWSITTAGSNRAGVCYDVRTYLTKLLNAVLKRHGGLGYDVKGEVAEDESFWGVIYTIDEGDDIFAESTWKKANPLYGISVDPEDLRRMATVAQVQAQALNEFLTKRLNVWVNADSAWMNMLQWDACGDRALKLEDFAGERALCALDAAFKKDLFAKVLVFRRRKGDGLHYYAFSRCYTNRENLEAKGNEHFAAWAREGRIRATDGNVLDIEAVREELQADRSKFDLVEVDFDPAQLTQFSIELLAEGFPAVEVPPRTVPFSMAMKELEEVVVGKRFHHDGDPVLGWAIANVVCHRDAKDNIFPRKDDVAKKIDPAIALIMAISRWLAQPVDAPDPTEVTFV